MFGWLLNVFRMATDDSEGLSCMSKREEPEKKKRPSERHTATQKPKSKWSKDALKYYGFVEGEAYDFANGRPYCVRSPYVTGQGIFENDFTGLRQDKGLTQEYKAQMCELIAQKIGKPEQGGKFWNLYFHCWVKEPLTPEYHKLIHEICREGAV